jgi:hypothetical protein
MMIPTNKKREFYLVTVLFSVLLGVAACCLLMIYDSSFAQSILPSILVMGFSWLSIHLACRRERFGSWMLLGMKMLLFFLGMPWVTFLLIMCIGDHETYPLVVVILLSLVFLFIAAIILIIPFGLLAYWISTLAASNKP